MAIQGRADTRKTKYRKKKETQGVEWETPSDLEEDYYSSQESETNYITDKEDESGEEDQQNLYITR